VYPYILGRDGGVEGHFFVNVAPATGLFRRYESEEEFYQCFAEWGKVHIRYERFEGAQQENLVLHPHFFRGYCVDWLLEDLQMGWGEVADFIGDEPETLKEYVYRHRTYDSTRALARVNGGLKAEREQRERPRREAETAISIREYRKELKTQKEELRGKGYELKKTLELMEREKNEKDELLRANRDLQRRVSSLEVENARLLGRPAMAL
jgi:hypothetical protein